MTRMKVLAMAAAIAGGLGFASAATAAPLGLAPADVIAGDAVVSDVTYFYGPGYGYYRPRPFYRPYGFYGPRPYYGRRFYGGRGYYSGYGRSFGYGGYGRRDFY